jgi:WXXGXW repeat (2 copies)
MFGRGMMALAVCGGLVLALLEPAPGRTEQTGRVPDAPEALTRGPVHEAYAQPTDSQARPSGVIQREPPTVIEEQPPDQKPEGAVVWVPGYWQWDEDRADFIWVSGFWRVPPPGRLWVPGSYRKVEGGYQWVPGMWSPEKQEQPNLLPSPPPSVEAGPSQPAPSEESVYVPGTWVYRETRYLWRPGYFIAYRPDYTWVPAHYIWTPAGFVYVEGYWDYPLARRGLLFAPVAFPATAYLQPGFTYTPNYVVNADFLATALFVRPAYGHYYFGDFYGPTALRAGYTPWVDYRVARGVSDPLFAQVRIGYGGAPWEREMRTLYAERAAGNGIRPPRTVFQQNTLLQSNSGSSANVRTVIVLSPLSQASSQGAALTQVSGAERLRHMENGRQIRERAILRSHPSQTVNVNVQHAQTIAAPIRTYSAPVAPAPLVRHEVPAPHHERHSAPAYVNAPPVIHAAPAPAARHIFGARHSEPSARPRHSRPD